MRGAKIRVLVIDDSSTVRATLCAILASEPDTEVVGEAADGARGIELCERLRPDVISSIWLCRGSMAWP